MIFCDGHVESPTLQFLFADTSDVALSRQNRDHLPHREKLSPWISGPNFLLHAWPRRINVDFTNMSHAAKDSSSANDLLKNSSLYREFQAEREEILRHKWIESEKAGRDIAPEKIRRSSLCSIVNPIPQGDNAQFRCGGT